ncbi:MAG TPA: DUF4143 domain-containing protein [Methanocorpusculum sp.]|nr:DUF4143 domain-containing protein [Methanocorpusculum sp.]
MLTPDDYLPRLIDAKIEEYLSIFSAVCIEGPKWCGKTWTSMAHANSLCSLADPANNFNNLTKAQASPDLILGGDQPRLIDEWQEVPSIWDAVRFAADARKGPGKFILTGSSTPKSKGILHSGAGRIATIPMQTMSLYETGDSNGAVSLLRLFNEDLKAVSAPSVTLKQLIYFCMRGGWPENIHSSPEKAGVLPQEYLRTILNNERTNSEITSLNRQKLQGLIHSLARNESTLVNNQKLSRDISEQSDVAVDPVTIVKYLDILKRMFLIEEQPSFMPYLRSSRRIQKSPKRHFCDPALAVAGIGATAQMLEDDLETFGFIFESLCEHDLKIYAEANNAHLYHFHDGKGNEIDAVVELEDGRWGAFEIKLGANKIDEAAANLKKIAEIFRKEEGKEPSVLVVICGLCDAAYARKDGVLVVPITALKP